MIIPSPWTQRLHFHHVGVVTERLEATVTLYTNLGYDASAIYVDPAQQARIVLMHKGSEPMIELIAPDSMKSPAAQWVQRIRAGPYHTCYEVTDLEAIIDFLRPQRLFPVLGPLPAVAFDGRRVVFMWGNSSGLLEFLEAQHV